MFDMIMGWLEPIYGSFIRHSAGVWAGWLLAHGVVTGDQEKQITSAIILLGVVGWSFAEKYGKAAITTEFNNLMSQISNRGGGLPA